MSDTTHLSDFGQYNCHLFLFLEFYPANIDIIMTREARTFKMISTWNFPFYRKCCVPRIQGR